MRADERLLKYVRVWTTSDEESQTSPTTERQFDLARMLVQEMREIGIKDADMDKYGYVYGHVPATPGYEDKTAIGFIAHMDTAPDYSGENVGPQVIEAYDGNPPYRCHSCTALRVYPCRALHHPYAHSPCCRRTCPWRSRG